MIKNVIFDIGNVLTEFCWREFFESFGYSEDIIEKLADATTRNDSWNELDRGAMEVEDVIDLFVRNDPSIEKEIRQVTQNISGIIKKCDYAIPWITHLKEEGYHVYYLSNFFKKAEVECAHALDFLPYMDGGILSYKENLIKPDAAVYKLLMSRYELDPEECVFIDDRLDNCEAARALNITAIQFKSYEQVLDALREIGVN